MESIARLASKIVDQGMIVCNVQTENVGKNKCCSG